MTVSPSSNLLQIRLEDETPRGRKIEISADFVVLNVGIEPTDIQELLRTLATPVGNGGFLQEVHPKQKPVESQMEGIFIAGVARAPMNIQECVMATMAAASKATNILTKEEIEFSPFVAKVDYHKCTRTGRCVEECEYNAITLHNTSEGKTKAVIGPSLCSGCGACVPVCPNRAMILQECDLGQIEAQIEGMIKGV